MLSHSQIEELNSSPKGCHIVIDRRTSYQPKDPETFMNIGYFEPEETP